MQPRRDNLTYILLSLVAVILIFFTLRLQRLLVAGRAEEQNSGSVRVLSEQPTAVSAPATPTPAPPTPTLTATATTPPLPTATLTLIPILPLPTPTSAPATLVLATVAAPTLEPATATTEPPTPTRQLPTETPMPVLDYVFGYLNDRSGCRFVTEIIATLLEQKFELHIGVQPFTNLDALYAALAHTGESGSWIDFTFCYLHPNDSQYLTRYGSELKLIGSAYAQSEDQRWHLVSFSGHYVDLRSNQPCLYALFADNLEFGDLQFSEPDAATWIANHAEQVAAWTGCSPEE